jgi:hypothetical protein
MNKQIKFALKFIVSLLALLWVFGNLPELDWSNSATALRNISPTKLGISIVLFLAIYVIRAWRLRYWVQSLPGRRLPIREWVELYTKSVAIGSLTPGRLGDFSRIVLLAPTGIDLSTRTRVTVQDKITDILYIPVIICLTAAIVGNKFELNPNGLVTIGIVFLVFYFVVTYWLGRFLGLFELTLGWAATVVGLIFYVYSNTFLFLAVGIELPILDIAAIVVGVGALASLPISLGGIGVREGSMLSLLTLWGVEPALIPPILILEFIMNIIFPIAVYLSWRLVSAK